MRIFRCDAYSTGMTYSGDSFTVSHAPIQQRIEHLLWRLTPGGSAPIDNIRVQPSERPDIRRGRAVVLQRRVTPQHRRNTTVIIRVHLRRYGDSSPEHTYQVAAVRRRRRLHRPEP